MSGGRPKGRAGIPLLCLVRPDDQGSLLQAVDRYLRGGDQAGSRRAVIPHALYGYENPGTGNHDTAPPTMQDVDDVRRVLVELSRKLSKGANSGQGQILFQRLWLLNWLMNQDVDVEQDNARPVLLRGLRDRDASRGQSSDAAGTGGDPLAELADRVPNQWVALVVWVAVRYFRPLWFPMKASGRIAWTGAEYRWARRQPHLAPHDPGSFIGFAERLTAAARGEEDPEQLLRLLVNAFLADLRAAYRRRLWHPSGARHTAYAVVLLDGVTAANGGCRLLQLINDVRNDTGLFDPLLVIAKGEDAPLVAGVTAPAADTATVYRRWGYRIVADSRARIHNAWFMTLAVPPRPGGPARGTGGEALGVTPPLGVDRAPLWSRTWVVLTVMMLLIGVPAGLAYRRWSAGVAAFSAAHCGLGDQDPDAANLTTIDGECIGVSATGHAFQPGAARTSDVLSKIGWLNRLAEAKRETSGRPLISVAFIGILSRPGAPDATLISRREELEGIAAAQLRQLQLAGNDSPIVRVLVGNAGNDMRHGPEVARILHTIAETDRTVAGVVGLDQSRAATQRTIRALSAYGIPMVAATLSADVLDELTPMYFQVAPDNRRQADFVAGYADMLRPAGGDLPRRYRLVRSADPDDTYAVSLAGDLTRSLGEHGFATDGDRAIQPISAATTLDGTAEPRKVGGTFCGYPGIVVFAGRSEDFEQFVTGLGAACGTDRARLPQIIAGDDISEYVADVPRRNLQNTVSFDFVSFALGAEQCANGPGTVDLDSARRDLAATVQETFPGQPNYFAMSCAELSQPSLDGHAPLSYDSVMAIVRAVEYLREPTGTDADVPVTPQTVWTGLHEVAFDGTSGRIDFRTGQVTAAKAILMLRSLPGGVAGPEVEQRVACRTAGTAPVCAVGKPARPRPAAAG
ncbi:hypothetical protein GCM10010435_31160 [Winogradskya consettensis]|uniref:Uncharacterized protein n=1 Tax=Winogradskya consettensis TaxID=113560 RepID=A0A919SEN4_9ACTN|nr:hypothetical protein Aco04nite_20340 [Actinoplanes consettensis]